jgi:hypothetical protein
MVARMSQGSAEAIRPGGGNAGNWESIEFFVEESRFVARRRTPNHRRGEPRTPVAFWQRVGRHRGRSLVVNDAPCEIPIRFWAKCLREPLANRGRKSFGEDVARSAAGNTAGPRTTAWDLPGSHGERDQHEFQ